MTESNDGWGKGGAFVLGGVLGGLAGYALRANNGFGAVPYTMAAGGVTGYGEGCDIARVNARVDNIISQAAQNEVINAIASVNANVSQSAKDIYQTEIQNLLAEQQTTQNINDQFCKTREYINADGQATRASIAAFQDRYMSDRIADLTAENASLKSQLAMTPLYASVNSIQNTLNSVIGCTGVRTCGSCNCGNN
jgi:hypothetical protein